jgi:hypothetical protein
MMAVKVRARSSELVRSSFLNSLADQFGVSPSEAAMDLPYAHKDLDGLPPTERSQGPDEETFDLDATRVGD